MWCIKDFFSLLLSEILRWFSKLRVYAVWSAGSIDTREGAHTREVSIYDYPTMIKLLTAFKAMDLIEKQQKLKRNFLFKAFWMVFLRSTSSSLNFSHFCEINFSMSARKIFALLQNFYYGKLQQNIFDELVQKAFFQLSSLCVRWWASSKNHLSEKWILSGKLLKFLLILMMFLWLLKVGSCLIPFSITVNKNLFITWNVTRAFAPLRTFMSVWKLAQPSLAKCPYACSLHSS